MNLFRATVNCLIILFMPALGAIVVASEYAHSNDLDEFKTSLKELLDGERFLFGD